MTPDKIRKKAEEIVSLCGLEKYGVTNKKEAIEYTESVLREAILEERKRCADIADRALEEWRSMCSDDGEDAANAIRNQILAPEILKGTEE